MSSLDKPVNGLSPQYIQKTLSNDMKVEAENIDHLDTIEETGLDKFIWLLCAAASLGGFLFGYDTGIISTVLIYLNSDLGHELFNSEKELITSITSGGAFIGAIFAGLTADKYGRKVVIYMGCALFVIGAILQASAFGVTQMTIGRLVVGLGVGSAAMIIPLYIAEVSPAQYRGKMVGVNTLCITAGQLLSYAVGAGFSNISQGWRWMVGLGAVPAIILACLLSFFPESPRQLIVSRRKDEAGNVLRRIFPNATCEQIQQKIRHIEIHIELAGGFRDAKSKWLTFKQLFMVPANLRATLAACGVMALSQFCGFNTLMYYSATLFSVIGFKNPVGVGSMIAAVNFVFTLLFINIVDHFGRRRVLLSTVWGLSLFLGIAAVAFYFTPISPDLSVSTDVKIGWSAYLVLTSMLGVVIFFASGVGPLAWVSAELFPMEVRSHGTMLMTMSNWGPNIIISATFLTLMEKTTPTGTYGLYAVLCLIGWVAIYFCYPEVKGMTLESIKEIFESGYGIQKAREIQKEMKEKRKKEKDKEIV